MRMSLARTVALLILLTGCALWRKPPEVTLRFHEQVSPGRPASMIIKANLPRLNLSFDVSAAPTLTERDILEASLVDTAGGKAVLLKFDVHGAIKLDELTTRCRGQYIVVFLNAKPVAAVLLERRLTTGQFLLEGDFTDEQAQQLVDDLAKLGANQQRKWLNSKW